MFGYFHLLVPVVLALLPILLKVRRKRIALIWILSGYILYGIIRLGAIIIPMTAEMADTGQGDPQLMAGQISEVVVTLMLFAIIAIPLALCLFWAYKKITAKA